LEKPVLLVEIFHFAAYANAGGSSVACAFEGLGSEDLEAIGSSEAE